MCCQRGLYRAAAIAAVGSHAGTAQGRRSNLLGLKRSEPYLDLAGLTAPDRLRWETDAGSNVMGLPQW
jgi:hypothetical protein